MPPLRSQSHEEELNPMRLRTILTIIGVSLLLLLIFYFIWAMVLLGSVGGLYP